MRHVTAGSAAGLVGGGLFALLSLLSGGYADAAARLPGAAAVWTAIVYSVSIYALLGALAGALLAGITGGMLRRTSDRTLLALHASAWMALAVGVHLTLALATSSSPLLAPDDPVRLRGALLGAILTLLLFPVGLILLRPWTPRFRAPRLAAAGLLAAAAGALAAGIGLHLLMRGSIPRAGRPGSVIVVGVDGAGWSVLRPLLDSGRMPSLERIRREGRWGTMRALGPVHHSDWTSMVTGLRPPRHGILRSFLPDPVGYGFRIAGPEERRGAAVWGIASNAGDAVASVGWPATTPAEPVRGMIVGEGDLPGRIFPPEEAASLAATVPLEPDVIGRCRLDEFPRRAPELLERMRRNVANLRSLSLEVYRRERPTLFLTHVLSTDNVQHLFWKHAHPGEFPGAPGGAGAAPFADAIGSLFEDVDRWIGELREAAGPDALILVLSDHGMRTVDQPIVGLKVNVLLERLGYLAFQSPTDAEALSRLREAMARFHLPPLPEAPDAPQILEAVPDQFLHIWIDPARTRAYSAGSRSYENLSGIRVNRAGREPQGIVEPHEVDPLLGAMRKRLSALRVEGSDEPLFNDVNVGIEDDGLAYDLRLRLGGPAREPAGDRHLVDGDRRIPLADLLEDEERSGGHRMVGLFLAAGPGVRRGTLTPWGIETPLSTALERLPPGRAGVDLAFRLAAALRLVDRVEPADWGPTILDSLGLPVPEGLDGRPVPGIGS